MKIWSSINWIVQLWNGHVLLFIDDAEAAKHTDIQNMIKAVNIKDNTKSTKKTYKADAANNVFHTNTSKAEIALVSVPRTPYGSSAPGFRSSTFVQFYQIL